MGFQTSFLVYLFEETFFRTHEFSIKKKNIKCFFCITVQKYTSDFITLLANYNF